jgi:hypothetical protein
VVCLLLGAAGPSVVRGSERSEHAFMHWEPASSATLGAEVVPAPIEIPSTLGPIDRLPLGDDQHRSTWEEPRRPGPGPGPDGPRRTAPLAGTTTTASSAAASTADAAGRGAATPADASGSGKAMPWRRPQIVITSPVASTFSPRKSAGSPGSSLPAAPRAGAGAEDDAGCGDLGEPDAGCGDLAVAADPRDGSDAAAEHEACPVDGAAPPEREEAPLDAREQAALRSSTETTARISDAAPSAADPRALPPLSRTQLALRDKVRKVLRDYYQRPLNTRDRSPWEVMHALLAYEAHSRVLQGGPQGEPITAVGWLCYNQACKGRSLLYVNPDGRLRVRVGPALQGHHGQLLAMLAQSRIKADYPIRVEGKQFAIADLIAEEKLTCYPRTELTFKLIALQHYLPMDATWINDQGMTWDFPTLIREEIRQPVRTAACGGTHRLSGLSLVVKKRQRSGLPVDGEYAQAQQFVANYQNYAYRLQNPDGSLSTEWFRGPGDEPDLDRRLKTTGHILEWLLYAANDKQLHYHRTVRAVNYLCNIMWANRTRDWEAGPLGHALHALVLYDRLAFAPYDKIPQTPVAAREGQRR